jgi:hypothetical protein
MLFYYFAKFIYFWILLFVINMVLFLCLNIYLNLSVYDFHKYSSVMMIGIMIYSPILMFIMMLSILNNYLLIIINYIYIFILFYRMCFINEYIELYSYFIISFLPVSIPILKYMGSYQDFHMYMSCLFVLLIFNIYVIFSDYFSPLKYLFANK